MAILNEDVRVESCILQNTTCGCARRCHSQSTQSDIVYSIQLEHVGVQAVIGGPLNNARIGRIWLNGQLEIIRVGVTADVHKIGIRSWIDV